MSDLIAEAEQWDAASRARDRLPTGWRRHAREVHLQLVERWAGQPRGRWLKTDLQEELEPHRALIPHLAGSWQGIDVSPEVVARVRPAVPGALVADVRRLPFPDGGLDGVLSTSTLDHFRRAGDISVALADIHRVLRPGGQLILTMDNAANPLIRLRNALPERLRRASGLVPYHVGPTLSERTGRAALARAGFEVVAVEHLLHAPHVIGTRPARFGWYERQVLPRLDVLGRTPVGRFTGHFVAFHCRARTPAGQAG